MFFKSGVLNKTVFGNTVFEKRSASKSSFFVNKTVFPTTVFFSKQFFPTPSKQCLQFFVKKGVWETGISPPVWCGVVRFKEKSTSSSSSSPSSSPSSYTSYRGRFRRAQSGTGRPSASARSRARLLLSAPETFAQMVPHSLTQGALEPTCPRP